MIGAELRLTALSRYHGWGIQFYNLNTIDP
ncbi:protein of unknown function [Acidithiobacillus ferrivorans]|uniref:Uncharacterized protein n=1 Tax=Acidithiobacillus ferrivorans TaxID=160808 RepID=A0ABY1MS28_9PROT|nr:protein of unknown function [Acidithiobacillus ferrivorans]